jgi:hypothetical protein
MPSLIKFVAAALAISLAMASPLDRRLASDNISLINELKLDTQGKRINSLIQNEPNFGNFKFNFLGQSSAREYLPYSAPDSPEPLKAHGVFVI